MNLDEFPQGASGDVGNRQLFFVGDLLERAFLQWIDAHLDFFREFVHIRGQWGTTFPMST